MKFEVVREFTKDGNVILWAIDGLEIVLAYVTREAFEDGIPGVGQPTVSQLHLLAVSNIDALSRVATAKFEAGEVLQPEPGARRYVMLTSDDLLASRERFSSSILTAPPFTWHTA